MNPWRAGCGESRTSGSEGGPGRRTGRKVGTAPWPDPYTYVRTWSGFCYVAFVEDAFSGRIVGYSIDSRMKASLAVAALRNAIELRQPSGTVVHSDRGSPGGIKWSSQHPLIELRVGDRSGLRRESASRASCEAAR